VRRAASAVTLSAACLRIRRSVRLHNVSVSTYVELRDGDGQQLRGMPDPSGGMFDAAGDFDRFLPDSRLPVLSTIDPFATTHMTNADMARPLQDLPTAESETKGGPEGRGLTGPCVCASSRGHAPASRP
jgi:hypothetical protein